ncbi:MAG: acyl-CoA dehydrogenase family protein [Geminicoccaceae bacterium]
MTQFTCPSVQFSLGENAEAIRDLVAGFAQREIAPLAAEIDRSNSFPRQPGPSSASLGLLGVTVEEEYGGSGLGYLEHTVVVEEISRASAMAAIVLRGAFEPVRQPDPPLGQPMRRNGATCPACSRASMSARSR